MEGSDKDVFVAILRDIARQINAFDESDFAEVIAGNAKLQLSIQDSRRTSQSKREKLTEEESQEVVEALKKLSSREEGLELLGEHAGSKEELNKIARVLDIPIKKGEQVDLLRSRIIESTIGYRLNSAAIKGNVEKGATRRIDDEQA